MAVSVNVSLTFRRCLYLVLLLFVVRKHLYLLVYEPTQYLFKVSDSLRWMFLPSPMVSSMRKKHGKVCGLRFQFQFNCLELGIHSVDLKLGGSVLGVLLII